MLKLSISLLLTAICALFGLGVFFDQLAEESTATVNSAAIEYRVMEQVIRASAQQPPAQLANFVADQAAFWQQPMRLRERTELAVPAELVSQLHAEGGLSLQHDDKVLIYRALPEHPRWLLELQLQDTAAPQPSDLWLTLGLYGTFCAVMLLWAWPLMRRLWLLHHKTTEFGQGRFASRIPESRWSYIPRIEHAFNQMAQQIEQLLSDNKLLTNSLSHDLRTPIACLRFGLEAATDEQDPQQKDRYLARMEQDLQRMEAMVTAVLQYASLDRLQWQQQKQHVDFSALCHDVAEQCRGLRPNTPLHIDVHLPNEPVYVFGHAHWLHCALLNVMQNAVRHSKQQVSCDLRLTHQHELILTITDDGCGIAKADAERIFAPFVRLGEPQNHQFGLGLALVRKILSWHGASIAVARFAPEGASFQLIFHRGDLRGL